MDKKAFAQEVNWSILGYVNLLSEMVLRRTLLGTKPLFAITCTNTLHALNDRAYIAIPG